MARKVIVIGGGVVGLCTAYFLSKNGHQVTVIDKSSMDSGASYVNAGYLTPSHIIPLAAPGMISMGLKYMFNSSSPFYMKPRFDLDFFKWAWNFKKSCTEAKVAKAIPAIKDINILSRELFFDLKESGDLGAFHLERKGLLMLYQTQETFEHELQVAEKARFLGLEVNELDTQTLKNIEPNVKINAKGAIHYECDAHSTPSTFMHKLQDYLKGKGVALVKQQEVVDFEFKNDKLTRVKTDNAFYDFDEVVLAAGSWSTNLAKKLGLRILVQAGKGYRINVSEPTDIGMPAILMEAKMAVTPMQGYTRFAGTMEFSGINHQIRKERVAAIAKGAENFYEDLKISEEDKNNAECGLRPVSPDGLPYIGRSSKYKNLTIATGHAMMGWSLGPATGKLVSEIVSGQKTSMDITPFYPERKF
ncbi:FAD-dependent oxidoreductase [uncultured Croceitalea sp.]|uniref:NAD(P)/FAD-dependent oxidoreductase n=1 Tax=uncultured Croceitalea sp. TaxID=1798908 RepID=UPI0033058EDE